MSLSDNRGTFRDRVGTGGSSALYRECGGCGDLSRFDAVTCEGCGRLLVLTKMPGRNGKRLAA